MIRWLGLAILRLTGWRREGEPPEVDRCVLIASPHTSNWDGFFLLVFAAAYGIRVDWMGKDSLFRAPFGGLLRRLGGIPIDRSRSGNTVEAAVGRFREGGRLVLAVPPEGTRRVVDYWKSGFYHIAREADVPIVLGFLDYAERRGGFGPVIRPTDDVRADMDRIRAFYADKTGCHPELHSRVRLRMEDEPRD